MGYFAGEAPRLPSSQAGENLSVGKREEDWLCHKDGRRGWKGRRARTPRRNAASGGGFQEAGRKRAETQAKFVTVGCAQQRGCTSEDVRQEGPTPPEVCTR